MTDDRGRIASLLSRAGFEPQASAPARPLAGTGHRSYRIAAGGRDLVVRLPRGDTGALVDRHHERHNRAVAAARGLAPGILLDDPADGATVADFVAGEVLSDLAPAARAAHLPALGALLRRLHDGPAFLGIMDPWAKIALYLEEAGLVPADDAAFGALWPRLGALRAKVRLEDGRLMPCHIDPQPANVVVGARGLVLLDWEYAAMSHPLWDLAYASVEAGLTPPDEAALLAGYGGVTAGAVAPWKLAACMVSAAWCMARAAQAVEDAPMWRGEVANRLASLAAALDDPAASRLLEEE